jgi:hypothetical protein
MALISFVLWEGWKGRATKLDFRLAAFSEVRLDGVLGSRSTRKFRISLICGIRQVPMIVTVAALDDFTLGGAMTPPSM